MHQLEPEPISPAPERPRQRRKAPSRSQIPNAVRHPPRHVHRKPLLQHRPRSMHHARPHTHRLPPRALPLPTPSPKREAPLLHLDSASLPHRRPSARRKRALRNTTSPPAQHPPRAAVRETHDRLSRATPAVQSSAGPIDPPPVGRAFTVTGARQPLRRAPPQAPLHTISPRAQPPQAQRCVRHTTGCRKATPAANRRPPDRATAGEGRAFTVTAGAGLPRPVRRAPPLISKATLPIHHHRLDVITAQSAIRANPPGSPRPLFIANGPGDGLRPISVDSPRHSPRRALRPAHRNAPVAFQSPRRFCFAISDPRTNRP